MPHGQIFLHFVNYMARMVIFEHKEFHIFELLFSLEKEYVRTIIYSLNMFD